MALRQMTTAGNVSDGFPSPLGVGHKHTAWDSSGGSDTYEWNGHAWVKLSTGGAALVNASPKIVSVTPSDSTTYDPPLAGIRIGTAGDVVVTSGGVDVTISSVDAAESLPGEITAVKATGTTASNIIGWQR